MLELPETYAMAKQMDAYLMGRTIQSVEANKSPHKFAWFFGDPALYPQLLGGRTLGPATPLGSQVEVDTAGVKLLFGEGVNLRLYAPGAKLPTKHQLLLGLDDGSALVAGIQMYGGIFAFPNGANDNPYYLVAKEKPSPLTDAFDRAHFDAIVGAAKPSISVKALLATEQRIPGLGNGVLQDILFLAGFHPARPIHALGDGGLDTLYGAVKSVLRRMADEGGRDVEKDLFGKEGGYRTLLSRKTWQFPCPKCGGGIQRKPYLGGNVYFCPVCQPPA